MDVAADLQRRLELQQARLRQEDLAVDERNDGGRGGCGKVSERFGAGAARAASRWRAQRAKKTVSHGGRRGKFERDRGARVARALDRRRRARVGSPEARSRRPTMRVGGTRRMLRPEPGARGRESRACPTAQEGAVEPLPRCGSAQDGCLHGHVERDNAVARPRRTPPSAPPHRPTCPRYESALNGVEIRRIVPVEAVAGRVEP